MADSAVEIHVGDVGTVLVVTITGVDGAAINLSAATSKKLKLDPPGAEPLLRDAEFVTDGLDGKIRYTSVDGDFAIAGRWRLQAQLVLPGWSFHTSQATFRVEPNLGS